MDSQLLLKKKMENLRKLAGTKSCFPLYRGQALYFYTRLETFIVLPARPSQESELVTFAIKHCCSWHYYFKSCFQATWHLGSLNPQNQQYKQRGQSSHFKFFQDRLRIPLEACLMVACTHVIHFFSYFCSDLWELLTPNDCGCDEVIEGPSEVERKIILPS